MNYESTDAINAALVVETLLSAPIAVAAVLEHRELVPRESGFYAWWSRRGAIDAVPHEPHPLHAALDLFYVGISPSRPTSKQNISKRVFGQHLGGNTGSSTFRFVLASLLQDELHLTPSTRGDMTVLGRDDNERLSDWQRHNLSLTCCVRLRPWEIEGEVIALMQPPLNCAENASHPFHPRVRDARAQFRRRASR
jgi:hypothetical protein